MTGLGSTTSSPKGARDACGRAVAPTFTCMHFVRFLCSLHGVCVKRGVYILRSNFCMEGASQHPRRAPAARTRDSTLQRALRAARRIFALRFVNACNHVPTSSGPELCGNSIKQIQTQTGSYHGCAYAYSSEPSPSRDIGSFCSSFGPRGPLSDATFVSTPFLTSWPRAFSAMY